MRKMAATLCLTLAMLVGLPGLATSMDIKASHFENKVSDIIDDEPWFNKLTFEGWKNHPDENLLRAPLPNFRISLKGKIVNGDYKKVVSLIKKYGIPLGFTISSRGGDVFEAIRIGKLVRQLRVRVSVGDNCISSCFFILAAGVNRARSPNWSYTIPKRNLIALSKTQNAKVCGVKDEYEYKLKYGPYWLGSLKGDTGYKISIVGLHRPRFTDNHYRLFGFEDHENSYRKLIKHIREYLKSMDIPNKVIERMMSTSSNDIFWMCVETLKALEYAPFWHELILAKCGSPLPYSELKILMEYEKVPGGRFKEEGYPEGSVYRFLEAKHQGYQMCNYWQFVDSGKNGFSELGWDLPVRK